VNKITGDSAQMAAQVPALFEALSGMSVQEMLSKVRLIGDKSPKPRPGDDKSAAGDSKQ
jgi:flotillin